MFSVIRDRKYIFILLKRNLRKSGIFPLNGHTDDVYDIEPLYNGNLASASSDNSIINFSSYREP
jgi:hypothetical protein